MAKNGEKWRKMAMANSPFSFVKFAISPLAPPPPPSLDSKGRDELESPNGELVIRLRLWRENLKIKMKWTLKRVEKIWRRELREEREILENRNQ